MPPNTNTILFFLPVAFHQKPDEPGFQVQTQNFRTTFEFVLPELRKQNCKVALVSINNINEQLQNGLNYIRQTGLDKDCQTYFFNRKLGRGKLIPQFFQFFINLFFLWRVLKKTRPALLYGYNEVGTLYGSFLKPFFGYKLVYDMRGNRVNEMAVQGAPHWRVWLSKKVTNICLNASNLVFTVSDSSSNIPSGKRHIVKYNFFDARQFFFDADVASKIRRKLGIEKRFIFVYSGTDKHYQMVPEMVRFFAGFRKICPDAWFMINTPVKSERFIEALKRNNIPPSAYGMFQLKQESLNQYQMVADMAFLIRDDLPLNREAFPTKFSEYLGSGVPVLITPHVHSLANLVEKHNLGVIWEDHQSEKDLYPRILEYKSNTVAKEKCSTFAREHLSWQKKATWLADILTSLVYEK